MRLKEKKYIIVEINSPRYIDIYQKLKSIWKSSCVAHIFDYLSMEK